VGRIWESIALWSYLDIIIINACVVLVARLEPRRAFGEARRGRAFLTSPCTRGFDSHKEHLKSSVRQSIEPYYENVGSVRGGGKKNG
jgi:hypothetical protein